MRCIQCSSMRPFFSANNISGEFSDVSQTNASKNQTEFDGVNCYYLVCYACFILLCNNNVDKYSVKLLHVAGNSNQMGAIGVLALFCACSI